MRNVDTTEQQGQFYEWKGAATYGQVGVLSKAVVLHWNFWKWLYLSHRCHTVSIQALTIHKQFN